MSGYPRDLVGYADQPPDPRWPGGARLALNFVVNYEEGERSVLDGDKVAETRLTDLAPLQGARDLNMESAYEYGWSTRRGYPLQTEASSRDRSALGVPSRLIARKPRWPKTSGELGCV
jgi:hypothetical protein